MIDHTAVNVTDLGAAKAFYSQALEPLGYAVVFEFGEFVGFNEPNGDGSRRRAARPGRRRACRLQVRGSRDGRRVLRGGGGRGGKDNGAPGSAPTTTSTTTPRSSTTRTATTSRPSARRRSDGRARRCQRQRVGRARAVLRGGRSRCSAIARCTRRQGALAYFADADGLDFGIGRRDARRRCPCGVRLRRPRDGRPLLRGRARRRRSGQRRPRVSARSTTRTTTRRTCSTPTATTSRPSATRRRPRLRACPGSR